MITFSKQKQVTSKRYHRLSPKKSKIFFLSSYYKTADYIATFVEQPDSLSRFL